MPSFDRPYSQPIVLTASTEAQTYAFVALALALTVVGVFVGLSTAELLLNSGMHLLLFFAEMGLLFTAPLWIRRQPFNYMLFGLVPLLSGITFTPYILFLLLGYANGAVILLNALFSTVFLSLAAAVFARTTRWNLTALSRGLFFAILGLLLFGILQLFVPMLRSGAPELMISGIGIAVFGLFLSMDLQRVQAAGRLGASPLLLALSLYLDIFNLFIYILRFMTAMSGQRR